MQSFFQSIIKDLPQKETVIYLRGVQAQEMKPILQFYHDRMNDFLNFARSLEIQEISKDVDCGDAEQDSDIKSYHG